MADYYAIPTHIGEAKLARALALGVPLEITHLAIGDGEGPGAQGTPLPDPAQTALRSERRRAPLNTLTTDPTNTNVLVAEQVIPEDIGGWWIREMGLIDADGDLIAVCNTPPTYKPVLASGSGRTQVVRMQIIVTDTSAVTLRVDPAVVLATRKYVDQQRQAHEESRSHPAATETEQGMVQLATVEAALAGRNKTDSITPFLLAERLRGIPFPFPGEAPPPGAIAYNGAEVLRADFPELWRWAQRHAIIVTDAAWSAGQSGLFSSGDGEATFRVPDLRGEFIRGWDAGRGVDAGRTVGGRQAHDFEAHDHTNTSLHGGIGGTPTSSTRYALTYYETGARVVDGSGQFGGAVTYGAGKHGAYLAASGQKAAGHGLETRPRNVALLWCAFY